MAQASLAGFVLSVLFCCLTKSAIAETTEEQLARLKEVTKTMSEQLMLHQFYVREQTRNTFDSGIKQVRVGSDGTKPYYTSTHTGSSALAIHTHSDFNNTIGMGELVVVMNGVEFRTRHNDYKLKMASQTSKEYHATEDIPYPPVPPAVQQLENVNDQAAEMRLWFKAWKNGNRTERDYRPYFTPVLCYLEGAWSTNVDQLEEPFDSDRHAIDASSWKDLRNKIRMTSYTGLKDASENYAYLPTTILNVTDDGTPFLAQWNYRILCHPIKKNIKLSDLKPVDNLAYRKITDNSFDNYQLRRGARFRVSDVDTDRESKWDFLDELMSEIPGKDNYKARISDYTFGISKKDVFKDKTLNVGFYNQWYKVLNEGAMGQTIRRRGFSDRNLYVAATTQPNIAPVTFENCTKVHKKKICNTVDVRVSYAIPLEIIWLTPLGSWNPYNITYKGHYKTELGMTVRDGKRNGEKKLHKAFNGTNSKTFYQTPIEFFSGEESGKSSADTTRSSVGVLDREGNLRSAASSGIRVTFPKIDGVGELRQRFPIAPIASEGSDIWKELEALRDIVLDLNTNSKYLYSQPAFGGALSNETVKVSDEATNHIFVMSESHPDKANGLHTHTVEISAAPFARLVSGEKSRIKLITSTENNHEHELILTYNKDKKKFHIYKCDGEFKCWDGHDNTLKEEK